MTPKIQSYKSRLDKASGNQKQVMAIIDAIRDSLCSQVLGREWLETPESYYARRPDLQQFSDWAKTISICEKTWTVSYI